MIWTQLVLIFFVRLVWSTFHNVLCVSTTQTGTAHSTWCFLQAFFPQLQSHFGALAPSCAACPCEQRGRNCGTWARPNPHVLYSQATVIASKVLGLTRWDNYLRQPPAIANCTCSIAVHAKRPYLSLRATMASRAHVWSGWETAIVSLQRGLAK
jgi:hypothetical protein